MPEQSERSEQSEAGLRALQIVRAESENYKVSLIRQKTIVTLKYA
jgi:hypothetical protein